MMRVQKILAAAGAGTAAAAGIAGAVICIVPKARLAYKYKIANPLRHKITKERFALGRNCDRIHFLNTGWSDAILLESDGKFALVDCAEDTDNPRNLPDLAYKGYEEKVLQYVKKHAAGENGKAVLEFIVGTHAHSDHIGGFDTLLYDDAIVVKKAYLKPYDASKINDYEVNAWDNQEVYDQMVHALNAKGVEIISDISDDYFEFGNFRCRFYNNEIYTGNEKRGENENSLALYMECKGKTVLLAGDINNICGTETEVADKVGKINLLKVPHHGNVLSTSTDFVSKIMPDIAVMTSSVFGLHEQAKKDLTNISRTSVYGTIEQNGIIATFTDNGITLTNRIHRELF